MASCTISDNENERSFSLEVAIVAIEAGVAPPLPAGAKGIDARRNHILDAFEVCIQRTGFHRTTMQDVAREAGMSAGNLYRYFSSKEALVSGLIERDRERFSADFMNVARSSDVMGSFIALGRKHFLETPRERCVQFMEIWAEASRNPQVAEMCAAVDREVNDFMVAILNAAKTSGQIPTSVDSAAVITVLSAMGDGLFTRRALEPDFDVEEGFRLLVNVMDALLSGKIELDRPLSAISDSSGAPPVSEGNPHVRG
ncbi:TetR/AcrR family transcriptional regulator [Labrys okinawensis]|uniref:TetR/AcrR family transcriptional regulator n=1 Tax=Labrys okinawensis TaxID=346911 RepID=A0A2S9QEZ1_9HYPH|nr:MULTISPECIES: TetR/AcrR family transcriptional regulator [Labrys]PRH87885.1 TetR/AcrR family transcriptional regulator [Labrys okinawensis]